MRCLAAALALLLAAPAAAQETPEWVGVWEGHIGTYPVRACFAAWGRDGPGRGSYYYLSRLEPIGLSDEESEGGWTEQGPDGSASAAWEFAEQSATAMRGTWRQGRRSLPFELTPLAWSEGEWGGPCSSAAFLLPRVGGGAIVPEDAELDGWRYTKRAYRPAAHFADNTSIETFSFPAEQPGDGAVNTELASYLPRETADDAFLQCFAGQIGWSGFDGFFGQLVEPHMVSRDFLTVAEANETSCGGAHPNTWTVYRTFDRQSGEPVDLYDWIDAPLGHEEARPLPDRLREVVLAHFPNDRGEEEGAEECREVVARQTGWNLELTLEGLSFTPDLPRVVMACGDSVLLTWKDLEPFLDAEGRAGLARLQAD